MTTTTDNVQPIAEKAKNGQTDFSDVYKNIVQLQQKDKDPAKFSSDMKQLTDEMHKNGILTDLQITGIDGSNHFQAVQNGKQVDVVASNIKDTFEPGTQKTSLFQGIENVAGVVWNGAKDEVENHPLHLVESAAIGLGIGAAAVGVAAVSPFLATGAAVLGGAYAGYQVLSHLGQWGHEAAVVANPEAYSPSEVGAAKQGAENFGAGATDVAAGVLGGIAGGWLGSAVKSAIVSRMAGSELIPPTTPDTDAPPPAQDDAPNAANHAHAQQPNIAQAVDINHTHAVNGALPIDHTHVVGGLLQGNPGDGSDGTGIALQGGDPQPVGDAPQAPEVAPKAADVSPGTAAAKGDVPPAAATTDAQAQIDADAAKAEAEVAAKAAAARQVEESVARTQSLFKQATSADGDGIIPSTKQDYNVMFQKVLEPTKIPTLENPAGADVQPGQWIATRLNADGTPNMERGMVNQWSVTDKTILKTYQTTPDELSTASKFIAATKTDAPPVNMVKLTQPITIQTSWGPMNGLPNDYLANYDYDPLTGQPGQNYAIVTNSSYSQTYQPVPPKVAS
jgi:hypothetical protein